MTAALPTVCSSQPLIKSFCELMRTYLDQEAIESVYHAYVFSAQAHGEQKRLSGEPYISHPISVAYILAQMHMDAQTLSAAMLHDVIEDTPISREEIVEEFDETIAMLVDGVSKLSIREITTTRQVAQANNISRVLKAMQQDIRVIIIKLADRLHNMRTIGVMKRSSQYRISRETLEIYAPIATRLGMNQLRIELEELCFSTLYPLRYRVLSQRIKFFRRKREKIFNQMQASIEEHLKKHNIKFELIRRVRHCYGIYCEMLNKKMLSSSADSQKTFEQSMGTYTFQVIVGTEVECYQAMGALHSLYTPMAQLFKDYIAIPKRNGYQSLHIVLFSSHGEGARIKIQIRTQAMHEQAELGIVARGFGNSKESTSGNHELEIRQHITEWLSNLLEIQQSTDDSLEFVENLKHELLPREISVFKVTGEAVLLPKGSTIIDFAYALGSNIGNKCVSGKINGQPAILTTPLSSGQIVEVVTAEWGRPKTNWMNFAVSARARVHIQHYLKNFQYEKAIESGKRVLDKELARYNLVVDKLTKTQRATLLNACHLNSWHTLLSEIGSGKRMAALIASYLDPKFIIAQTTVTQRKGDKPLIIKGIEDMMVEFSPCCHAIPEDEIVGLLRLNEGIIIHRKSCKKVINNPQEQWVDAEWEMDIKQQQFKVDLRVDVPDKRGVLATVAKALSNMHSNIDHISNRSQDGVNSTLELCVCVDNRSHLAEIMRHLKRLEDVIRIQRT